ncbi:protein OBERON 3 [Amborella trichopoda]|uniref:Uncharacterized protein n=1 Tax=Amborella trichopoda TaxID=13333 RepID=W1NZW0_AMBTC|nr:protein OBERON 3 [Amborella trichopoda]ERN00856.1 hypothetical protein AMTR_s00103p00104550 [Amborella trichopoda]|eukprot:XP_006838287.1 protein OBERON 3 [Amborella trichopoda]
MKRQRSYGEDLDNVSDKGVARLERERGRRDQEHTRMRSLKVLEGESADSHYRRGGYTSFENGRKGFKYEKTLDETRELNRVHKKRFDHGDSRGERKGFEIGRSESFRKGFQSDRIHRSNSSSISRRELYEPASCKGFRSDRVHRFHDGNEPERSHSRRSNTNSKETDEDAPSQRYGISGKSKRMGSEDRGNSVNSMMKSPQSSREAGKSPQQSKDSEEQVKSKYNKVSSSSSEMEEGELEPDPVPEPKNEPESKPRTESEPKDEVSSRTKENFNACPESSFNLIHKLKEENRSVVASNKMEGYHEVEIEREDGSERKHGEEIEREEGSDGKHEEKIERRGGFDRKNGEEVQIAGVPDKKHQKDMMGFSVESKEVLDYALNHGNEDDLDEVVKGSDGDAEMEIIHREECEPLPEANRVVCELDSKACDAAVEESTIKLSDKGIPSKTDEKKSMYIRENVVRSVVAEEISRKMTVVAEESARKMNANAICHEPFDVEKQSGMKDMDLDMEAEDLGMSSESNKTNIDETGRHDLTLRFMPEKLELVPMNSDKEGVETMKGKGKQPVLSFSDAPQPNWLVRDFLAAGDRCTGEERESNENRGMEGTSNRGFELFSHSNVGANKIANNSKEVKAEPLHLYLGLPDVSLTLASPTPSSNATPSSPKQARSVQSFPTTLQTRTMSDGFTTSLSFSGSQAFTHNPSCSLNQNSVENHEHSVGSRPIFSGVDQVVCGAGQGQSSNEQLHYGTNVSNSLPQERPKQRKEVPLYHRILQNGNGVPQNLQGGSASQSNRSHVLSCRVSEGSLGRSNGPERQVSFSRDVASQSRKEVGPSPSQSVGSRETRPEHIKPSRGSQRYPEQLVERMIYEIVSEPILEMARRLQDMPEQSILFLKEHMYEMMVNKERQGHLLGLQEKLQKRSELTMDMLSKAHKAQLELLVAIRTGLKEFLRLSNNFSYSDLVEILLNLKCRNLLCLNQLPVDECECKVCAQKNGFCSACMCLVCSKFDFASNTCSWVGCDVCLHWCHTDCGLHHSHIRNGHSATGSRGALEMQFHCVACDHPSEMFGFVKEVFRTCGKDWSAETLAKEIEYVRRIFRGSVDLRGKRLYEIADQMLSKLENRANHLDVYASIMIFLSEGECNFGGAPSSSAVKDVFHVNQGKTSNGLEGSCQDAVYKLPHVASAEKLQHLENGSAIMLTGLDWEQGGRRNGGSDLPLGMEKKPVMDELESIVMMKEAEAKMYLVRAEDARIEAEGLKRISDAKKEQLEVEYTNKVLKLRLVETGERLKQKLGELQALEKVHRDYFNMKMRMEADIKDLLLKMEATKHNFSV